MKKSKVTMLAAAAALGGLLVVGGTLAWFTDTDTATNTVTMGNVDITLTENVSGEGITQNTANNGYDYEIMPGARVDKNPTVENTGNNPAYVRAKVQMTLPDGMAADAVVVEKVNDTEWKKIDDYYYYKGAMAADAAASTIFDEVYFDGNKIGNKYNVIASGADPTTVNIKITAEAIQSENIDVTGVTDEFEKAVKAFSNFPTNSGE